MKKKKRGTKYVKRRATAYQRVASLRQDDLVSLRAVLMDTVLTPAEQAVWTRTRRHD